MWRADGPVSFYILCGNATFNRGDRFNLTAQIALLKERFPGARITVGSHRPRVDAAWYDARVIQRGWFLSLAQLRSFLAADVIVWGGGALMADNAGILLIPYWFLVVGFLKLVLRKPVMAWAHGIVLETRLGRFLARFVYNWTDMITVRDANSLRTLQALGRIRTPFALAADPAILIRPASRGAGLEILKREGVDPARRPIIAIAPTFWQYYHRNTDFLPYFFAKAMGLRRTRAGKETDAVVRALTRLGDLLVEKFQCQVLFLPRYPHPRWPDVGLLDRIKRDARHGNEMTVFHGDDAPDAYVSIWYQFRCLISIALHDAIVAAATGTPCLHLYYEKKGSDFIAALGQEKHMAHFSILLEPDGPERVAEMTRRLLDDWPADERELAANRLALEKKARENAEYLARLVVGRGKGRA